MSTLTENATRDRRASTGGPPPIAEDQGGGGARWVELATAGNDIEAHLLTGRLAEASVETRTVKDRSAPGAWLYGGSNPWAPVVVLVKHLQLEEARLVLAEISWTQPALDPAVPSPPPTSRSHAVAWWLAALALGLVFTSIALARTAEGSYSCDIPIVCPTESTP